MSVTGRPARVTRGLIVLLALAVLGGGCAKTADGPASKSRSTQNTQRAPRTDPAMARTVAVVTHVADGDTIDIDFADSAPPVRVRLLGIDTPELSGPTPALGQAARAWMVRRVDGQRVKLSFDGPTPKYDRYERMLAYVQLERDGSSVNEALVRDGQAFAHRTLTCKLTPNFAAAEDAARTAKRGLWKSITLEQMPAWRQRWLGER